MASWFVASLAVALMLAGCSESPGPPSTTAPTASPSSSPSSGSPLPCSPTRDCQTVVTARAWELNDCENSYRFVSADRAKVASLLPAGYTLDAQAPVVLAGFPILHCDSVVLPGAVHRNVTVAYASVAVRPPAQLDNEEFDEYVLEILVSNDVVRQALVAAGFPALLADFRGGPGGAGHVTHVVGEGFSYAFERSIDPGHRQEPVRLTVQLHHVEGKTASWVNVTQDERQAAAILPATAQADGGFLASIMVGGGQMQPDNAVLAEGRLSLSFDSAVLEGEP